jgi:hypothetical protein
MLFIRLVVLFVAFVGIYFVWDKFIHPLLFKEEIDLKLEDAVETKVLRETDKKVEEILREDTKKLLEEDD